MLVKKTTTYLKLILLIFSTLSKFVALYRLEYSDWYRYNEIYDRIFCLWLYRQYLWSCRHVTLGNGLMGNPYIQNHCSIDLSGSL